MNNASIYFFFRLRLIHSLSKLNVSSSLKEKLSTNLNVMNDKFVRSSVPLAIERSTCFEILWFTFFFGGYVIQGSVARWNNLVTFHRFVSTDISMEIWTINISLFFRRQANTCNISYWIALSKRTSCSYSNCILIFILFLSGANVLLISGWAKEIFILSIFQLHTLYI